jgi:hypothetical protein
MEHRCHADDRFVTVRLEHPATGPAMTVFIPHGQLVQLTKNCDRNESLLIDTTPGGPVIKFALADNLGESKVKLIPLAEFPVTPRIPGEAIPLGRIFLHQHQEGTAKVPFCIADVTGVGGS